MANTNVPATLKIVAQANGTKWDKVEWDKSVEASENARLRLPAMAAAYFAEVRRVLGEDPAPAELHRLRLASKHFRYTLERFRPCYGAALDLRIERLKRVQDLLGDCNDAVASLPLVEKALRSHPADRKRARKFLENLAKEKAAEFRQHWAGEFDAPGEEDAWTAYLRRARRPR